VNETVISARNIGKEYTLGAIGSGPSYRTIREAISDTTRRIMRTKAKQSQPRFWALKDISFEVAQGEVVGIIGRNGAGKSTLLKILSRITEPTVGELDLRGRVGSLLEVGTGFHPELTGRENIYLNGSILGMKRAEITRRFDEIVDFAEVQKFLDTPVKHYSSGMYTRLAFAVAAHLEPEILIIDEVLAVGDAAFQKKCLGKMGQVARGGRTVLFVSHQMAMIETLCTRAILLDQGRIVKSGETSAVVRAYLSELSEKTGSGDLSGIPRTGSGELTVKSFWVEDESGNAVPAVASGARVTLAFEYESKASPASRVSLGFGILGMDERPVTLLYNDYQEDAFTSLPSTGVIRFTFPRLPLSNGSYYVAARAMVNGIEADWPRGYIGRLEVDAGDFYGVGHPFHSGICPILVEGDWDVQATPETS
jgi:lipopolysaccharide transport system ATP-binding protein